MDFKVLLDANVLYPSYLRDLLLCQAERGFFQPHWTDQILHEVSSCIKKRQTEDRHDRVGSLISRLGAAFLEAHITGHEDLIPAMTNHPKDRHVLAAAGTLRLSIASSRTESSLAMSRVYGQVAFFDHSIISPSVASV